MLLVIKGADYSDNNLGTIAIPAIEDIDAMKYINALSSPLSDTKKAAINTFVIKAKTAGIWELITDFHLTNSNAVDAGINLKTGTSSLNFDARTDITFSNGMTLSGLTTPFKITKSDVFWNDFSFMGYFNEHINGFSGQANPGHLFSGDTTSLPAVVQRNTTTVGYGFSTVLATPGSSTVAAKSNNTTKFVIAGVKTNGSNADKYIKVDAVEQNINITTNLPSSNAMVLNLGSYPNSILNKMYGKLGAFSISKFMTFNQVKEYEVLVDNLMLVLNAS